MVGVGRAVDGRRRRRLAAEAATAAAAIASETATVAAAEAAAVSTPEAAAIAAEAATVAVTAFVAVALAHLDGRLGLMRLDAHGDEADDVGRQAHAPLHLGDRRRRGLEVHERVVSLAVFLDLESDGLQPPVLGLGNFASAFLDDLRIFLRQRLDLRLTDILACQEDMLIERHGCRPFLPFQHPIRRKAPFEPEAAASCTERPKRPERAKTLGAGRLRPAVSSDRDGLPFSLQPERVTAAVIRKYPGPASAKRLTTACMPGCQTLSAGSRGNSDGGVGNIEGAPAQRRNPPRLDSKGSPRV